jgi:hypothetical protein
LLRPGALDGVADGFKKRLDLFGVVAAMESDDRTFLIPLLSSLAVVVVVVPSVPGFNCIKSFPFFPPARILENQLSGLVRCDEDAFEFELLPEKKARAAKAEAFARVLLSLLRLICFFFCGRRWGGGE